MKNKYKKFVDDYENRVKKYRDEYYKNIVINSSVYNNGINSSFIYLGSFVVGFLILIFLDFSIISYIIAFVAMLILSVLIKFLIKLMKLDSDNNYLNEIRKLGFFSIDDYEKKLKSYVIGNGGYYENLLNELIKEYNINETVRKISGINGEEYYIWTNQHQDKINLLNSKINVRPEVKSIKISAIRYYRLDNQRKMIVLKTDVEEMYFNESALPVFNEMIKMKKLENLITFNPEDYINDFELYMHGMKSSINNKIIQEKKILSSEISKLMIYLIAIGALIGLGYLFEDYKLIINIVSVGVVFLINRQIKMIINSKVTKAGTDDEYIKYFNSNQDCLEKFRELKYSLGISDSFDKVYTTEGACYLTWVANGYFHVFLNMVFFNVVYMAINTSDVLYYKVEGKECLLKLKDKTLAFTSDAAIVFAKVLPNKDYQWLKGYQNN